jgi:predicted nucleotidyltransferase
MPGHNEKAGMMNTPFPSPPVFLPDKFLDRLVAEFDDETVRAIILHGSYARGDALPPYSDVDLVRVVFETPEVREHKRFLTRDGYLLSVSTRPLSTYQQRLALPEKAIFTVSGIQEARILLDKDGAFRRFQQEMLNWQWSPLQEAANAYASQLLLEQTEIVLKILRALHRSDGVALIDMIIFDLLPAVTDAIAVQRGIVVKSGNTYLYQVQEAIGRDTEWTRSYMIIVDAIREHIPSLPLEQKGKAALRLYQATVQLLDAFLLLEHREPIMMAVQMIDEALA